MPYQRVALRINIVPVLAGSVLMASEATGLSSCSQGLYRIRIIFVKLG
jgi:hypothetical protein